MKKPLRVIVGMALLLISCQLSLMAQKANIFEHIKNHEFTDNWIVLQEDDLVRISVKYSDCSDPANGFYPEYLLFKVENKSDTRIHTYWKWNFAYNGKTASKSESDEELVKLTLDGFKSVEGVCSHGSNDKLRLFVREREGRTNSILTDFSVTDFHVFKL